MALDPGDSYVEDKLFDSEEEAKYLAAQLNTQPIGMDSLVRYDATYDNEERRWRVYQDLDGAVHDMVGFDTYPMLFAGKMIYGR